MNVHFSRQSDEWRTPPDLFARLDQQHHFTVDVAATAENALCPIYLTDALAVSWLDIPTTRYRPVCWCNPPYSQCRAFIEKAAAERRRGVKTVCLVPSRTDTRWWHAHVWDGDGPRAGVHVEFLKGRLKFSGSAQSAPFPSVVITFQPPWTYDEKQLMSGGDR